MSQIMSKLKIHRVKSLCSGHKMTYYMQRIAIDKKWF